MVVNVRIPESTWELQVVSKLAVITRLDACKHARMYAG